MSDKMRVGFSTMQHFAYFIVLCSEVIVPFFVEITAIERHIQPDFRFSCLARAVNQLADKRSRADFHKTA